MKTIAISDVPYTNLDFEITDIFPVSWTNGNEFSLYKSKSRPCSALFFVFTDIEISFFSYPVEICLFLGIKNTAVSRMKNWLSFVKVYPLFIQLKGKE